METPGGVSDVRRLRPDRCRKLQLALATVWLLDGVLQFQPFMFTAGSNGFSGMLNSAAAGNPGAVARSITWNASIVDHHAVAADSAFALVQILIGLGIAWRPSVKPALAVSIVWSVGVWWFGEGLGGVLHGTAAPVGGGPGAVLFYALLAVLLWPVASVSDTCPFVAARAVGITGAKVIWAVVWLGLGVLALLGSGRSPEGLHDLIATYAGEPRWLSYIDHNAESVVANRGLEFAVVFAVICVVVALGASVPSPATKAALILAAATGALIWVVGENFGTILAGGATDPNSGPLLVLLALAYWPLGPARQVDPSLSTVVPREVA